MKPYRHQITQFDDKLQRDCFMDWIKEYYKGYFTYNMTIDTTVLNKFTKMFYRNYLSVRDPLVVALSSCTITRY